MTFFKYKQKVYTHAYIIFGYTQGVHVRATSSRRSSISMGKNARGKEWMIQSELHIRDNIFFTSVIMHMHFTVT